MRSSAVRRGRRFRGGQRDPRAGYQTNMRRYVAGNSVDVLLSVRQRAYIGCITAFVRRIAKPRVTGQWRSRPRSCWRSCSRSGRCRCSMFGRSKLFSTWRPGSSARRTGPRRTRYPAQAAGKWRSRIDRRTVWRNVVVSWTGMRGVVTTRRGRDPRRPSTVTVSGRACIGPSPSW